MNSPINNQTPSSFGINSKPGIINQKNGTAINFCLWAVLHQYAKNYPDQPSSQDKEDAKHFFEYFDKAIPCPNPCRSHYKQWIKDYPIESFLDTKSHLQSYIVDLHNDVNQRTNKPIFTLEKALEIQESNNELNLTQICAAIQNQVVMQASHLGTSRTSGISGIPADISDIRDNRNISAAGTSGTSGTQTSDKRFLFLLILVIVMLIVVYFSLIVSSRSPKISPKKTSPLLLDNFVTFVV